MRTCTAPVPAASSCVIRGSTSSIEYVSPTRSVNSESTSNGVARLPYTIRSATRCARLRTGVIVSTNASTAGTEPRPAIVAAARSTRYRAVSAIATRE